MDIFGGSGGLNVGDVLIGGKRLSGSGLIILNLEFEGGIGTGTTAMYIDGSGSAPIDYVVPAATTFLIQGIRFWPFSASATGSPNFYPGYADAVALNAALTNFVGAVSGVAGGNRRDLVLPANYSNQPFHEAAIVGRVPTGKYPAVQANTAGTVTGIVQLFGYEVV